MEDYKIWFDTEDEDSTTMSGTLEIVEGCLSISGTVKGDSEKLCDLGYYEDEEIFYGFNREETAKLEKFVASRYGEGAFEDQMENHYCDPVGLQDLVYDCKKNDIRYTTSRKEHELDRIPELPFN